MNRQPSCWLCHGTGYIRYYKNGAEYLARCKCPQGERKKAALPLATEIFTMLELKDLTDTNYDDWKQLHPTAEASRPNLLSILGTDASNEWSPWAEALNK